MPELNTAVVMTPDHVITPDPALQMATYWITKTVKKMNLKGLQVTHLNGDKAKKTEVRDTLSMVDPLLFWGTGHGLECLFTGQIRGMSAEDLSEWVILSSVTSSVEFGDKTFSITANPDWMEGRVVHLTSCLTAVELGVAIADAGALAYIGYNRLFIVGFMEHPPESKYTQSFMEPDIQIELTLLDGKSVKDAIWASDFRSDDWIEYWRRSGDPNADAMIKGIIWNKVSRLVFGDETIKIRFVPDALSPWNVAGVAVVGTIGIGGVGIVSREGRLAGIGK